MPTLHGKLAQLLRAVLPERPSHRRLAALRLAAPRRPRSELLNAASGTLPGLPDAGTYRIAVLLNVALGPGGTMINFKGFRAGHELAVASPAEGSPLLVLTVTAPDALSAAERAFDVGNHQDTDDIGVAWPSDLRSVSVGDVMLVTSPSDHRFCLAVASRGFIHVDPPRRESIVALVGSSATSRT
ncbi:hypothetical protein AB0D08_39250 [Kitasatospora sp. NPDC048540]|uniref:hypothetical protein n=1 Tax=Kitasatospora sp. NPDC048540 TaxID=3155634 RepID=UPI0033F1D0F4